MLGARYCALNSDFIKGARKLKCVFLPERLKIKQLSKIALRVSAIIPIRLGCSFFGNTISPF